MGGGGGKREKYGRGGGREEEGSHSLCKCHNDIVDLSTTEGITLKELT